MTKKGAGSQYPGARRGSWQGIVLVLVVVLDWCGVWHPREMGCPRRLVRDFSFIWMLARSIRVQAYPASLEDEYDDEDENDMPQWPLLAPRYILDSSALLLFPEELKLGTTA